MSNATSAARPTVHLLGRDYWAVFSVPAAGVTRSDLEEHLPHHRSWLLELEISEAVFLSGPLVGGAGVVPGSGLIILRAETEEQAHAIAASDPLVVHQLRTFELRQWRVNQGAIGVSLSLGTGGFQWL